MSYDSWDFEPPAAPEADSWDTWDSGPTSGWVDPSPPVDDWNNGSGNWGGKGDWGAPADDWGGKGDFGKGSTNFGKGFNDFGGKGGCSNNGKGKNDFGKGKGKGSKDFGKGGGWDDFGNGGGGDFGKGDFNDFGKGDFGKGDFGKGDFGKGDFGKGDFGKGDFGKGDFGKGDFGMDFGKGGGGMDFFDDGMGGKGMDDFGMKGSMGKGDFGCGGGNVVPPPPGKGMVVPPPSFGAAPKFGGQFVPAPRMPLTVMPPQKGFDGGKGGMPFGMKGGMQPFGGAIVQPPPPPGGPMMSMNGSTPAFAKSAPGSMGMVPGPDMLALGMGMGMDAMGMENVPPPMDDGTALKPYSGLGEQRSRLLLLLTRLAPDLENEHMQQILEQCGEVQGWRRAKDPLGLPLSFGFAQFADAEAAWKANICISKLELCGSEIKVLLEEQTENVIQGWRNMQQAKMNLSSAEEFEWEMERKSVACKAQVEAKVEEIYGPAKGGGVQASKRREELRKKEQARILRVRKRKAWREDEFSKELERVESLEKRLRRDEREKDGLDRTKEAQEKPKPGIKDESDLKSAKKEDLGEGEGTLATVGTLAVISNDNRVLNDLVDRIQAESRDSLFKMDLDVSYLRNEKSFEKKLRPWLEQKIDLYMGGPQSDLVEYVLRRVNAQISAEALVSDLQKYLDDNASGLVERMWRMLIFELMRGGLPMGGKVDKEKRRSRISD